MENPLSDIERIEQIPDPVERAIEAGRRLNEIPKWTTHLKELRRAAVQELRAKGWSHAQVADALGIHRNRAAQIADGKPGGGKGGGAKDPGEPEPDHHDQD